VASEVLSAIVRAGPVADFAVRVNAAMESYWLGDPRSKASLASEATR